MKKVTRPLKLQLKLQTIRLLQLRDLSGVLGGNECDDKSEEQGNCERYPPVDLMRTSPSLRSFEC